MDFQELPQLIAEKRWWALAAVAIGLLVRLSKADVPWLPTIPPEWRPRLALALGVAAAMAKRIADGGTVEDALAWGLGAAAAAVVGHEVIIEGARRGQEFGGRGAPPPAPPPGLNGGTPPPRPSRPSGLQRSFEHWRPLIIIATFLGWVVGGTAVACFTGCNTARDVAVASLNASSDFGAEAERGLADLDRQEQLACVDHAAGANAADNARVCVARVRARYRLAWDAYRTYRAAWLAAAAAARAYDNAEAVGRAPDPANVLLLVRSLADAEIAFAAALAALRPESSVHVEVSP